LIAAGRIRDSWEEMKQKHITADGEHEDLLIRNTYLNSKNAPIAEIFTNGAVIERLARQ